ncbi:MAG: Ni,Fe-hydrogenase I large subunit [Sulfurimonas sp.]|jgi:Ni,Fe-hydrogenase I large subunit|uniref:nickel-dependent hydrogenase large subunit n=1 Tax=Sulfurimonas sp. TaxID=2022749 RepID=UPI0039E2C784
MSKTITLDVPLNRVEGDLDIRVTIEDGVIIDAKSIGTMYRGFENILQGRDALDALVITPRICGICSVTHLSAAVDALEAAQGIIPPAQAVRLRNLSLLSETIQSDVRQFFLMYMGDFAHSYYEKSDFYTEAKEHYEAFKGSSVKKALKSTAEILKVVAIIGGQWPHTSHIVPGGISTTPTILELALAQNHIENFISWYEENVLACDIDSFMKNITRTDKFFEHMKENPNTDIARFTNYAEQTNLFEIGRTSQNFLSYGTINNPLKPTERFIQAGVIIDGKQESLNIQKVTEDISHGWYKQVDIIQNPEDGVTQPDMKSKDGYSWAKAPRYDANVMQTGPLAQALINVNKLIVDLNKKYGDCAYVRELARILRPAVHLAYARKHIKEAIENFSDTSYIQCNQDFSAQGVGLVEAARGSLGHWVNIERGKIKNYQIVTPTAWNGSPKDSKNNQGAWEKSLIGLRCKDIENPMEMGHVIRSFDPCLVCTVHTFDVKNKKRKYRFKIGL